MCAATLTPLAAGSAKSGIRQEVQALRALAVTLVVLYHVWPETIPGGFVGVDVFFAVSGFLITSLLLREVEAGGTISLVGFWARRARRILPAALLTILVSAAATLALVPLTSWDQFFTELQASAAYVQNFHLASSAVDYFAADDGPSIAQHFWTLSVEEQFYVVWPLLLLAALRLTRGRPAAVRRTAITATIAILTALSLAFSIDETAENGAAAYFLTPARAWEFGAGALLACARPRRGGRTAALLSWLGLAAIILAALAYSDATPFPGSAALLPVLGAVAVMWAGMPDRGWAPSGLLRLRAVQALGDISYAVYLWHWPLLILAPFLLGGAIGLEGAAGVIVLTLVAAALTKRFVEDPVRRTRLSARRTLLLGLAATAAVVGATTAGGAYVDQRVAEDARETRQALEERPRCFGAASRDRRVPCRNPRLARMVVPTPIEARQLGNDPCTIVARAGRVHVCAFGASPRKARGAIALIGDSHASHWRAALDRVARAERWRGLSLTRTGCPFSASVPDASERARTNCAQWNREVRGWLASHPEVDTVFVTAHSGAEIAGARPREQFAAQRAAFVRAWRSLPPSVKHVVVIRDTPKMRTATLACVQEAIDRGLNAGPSCAVPRSRSLDRDPAAAAARSLDLPVVDLTRQFCDRRRCFPVVGGALVFRDVDHLTPTFAETLAPLLRRVVDRIQRTWRD